MTFINNNFISKTIFNYLVSIFNLNLKKIDVAEEWVLYIQFSTIIINITLFLFIILLLLNFSYYLFFKKTNHVSNFYKIVNYSLMCIILYLLIVKLVCTLKFEHIVGPYLPVFKEVLYIRHTEVFSETSAIMTSSLSDAILLLSFLTGLICLEFLGFKSLLKSTTNISIFYSFNIFVIFMVTTNNLLIMFLSFEFIFFPTIYMVYKLGYVKKVDKANRVLFYWTLFGSFLVLCALGYLYYFYNTLDYIYLKNQNFSNLETKVLFFIILLGFGVKIPLAPFHYWLLMVHVQVPTGFSIFLSGFLVKSALYCLFMLLGLFYNSTGYFILVFWIFYGLITATLSMGKQVDIKKLIAWATIQEMTFMLIFILFKQILLTHICILFILMHGLMSTYMFYIVDIIQRRYKTRALQFIKGVHISMPRLSKHIWFLILLFSGFPLTAKFYIEWSLLGLVLNADHVLALLVIMFVNFLGSIFFCRIMFSMLYSVPEDNYEYFIETNRTEYSTLAFISFFICALFVVLYSL